MLDRNKVTKKDMRMVADILTFTSFEDVPLCFSYGGVTIRGIPESFSPTVESRVTADTVQYVIKGRDKRGLSICAEYTEYRSYPVTEWLFYLKNDGACDGEIIKNVRIEGTLVCPGAVLIHGNGDTCAADGYHFFKTPVDQEISLTPTSGTSCEGAFPYMTLSGEDREIRAAIGWPAKWAARLFPSENGITLSCGQDRCATRLHPGEVYRTPRLTLMVYTKENAPYRGINLWRSWYFSCILPREDGRPLAPKLCVHYYRAEGKPEFTGATEDNQLHALKEYLRRGRSPDVYWMDAGWYPCGGDWSRPGTWCPDPERFPHGLGPLGKACEEHGMQLLLWFEPERVCRNTELERGHREWLLASHSPSGGEEHPYLLLDLGNKEALEFITDRVDRLIKESRGGIYRQDLNFDPLPMWVEHEAEDRIGMLENLHVQGLLAYWDALRSRNPSLLIDCCAAGGRRNDLETMRRAVPLHYTDVGYGNHPIKQKQHREMFEWIPYFRAHDMSWDLPDGSYGTANKPADEYDIHCALAPALTSMYPYYDTEEHFEIGRKMDAIWREAAELMLSGDYYPISECRGDARDWSAMQFDDPDKRRGFLQAIRNTQSEEGAYVLVPPCVHQGAVYCLCDRESGRTVTLSAEELAKGLSITLPRRTGILYFYTFQ